MTTTPADLAARLENVRVDIRTDLEITRQIFSGQSVYVLRDPIHSQSFQLSAADYQLLVRIHSRATLGEIFTELCETERLTVDDQEHFYRLILHFHQLGILSLPIADGKALHRRHQKWQSMQRRWSIQKILFRRIPIWKPDRFLERTSGYTRILFRRSFLVFWMVGVLACLTLIGLRWDEFRQPMSSMLATENLVWVWCLLVGLKAIHELGHAYACKIFGGHVPEIGIFLILFTPCAYVDASSSWGFPKRRHRLIVGLAGMYFESLCAMVACVVWVLTPPGLVHSLAVYAIALSTAITIGFNANPLMRYDGYFILSDLLNIPNLRSVSRDYFFGWCKHVAYGLPKPQLHFNRSMRWFMGFFGAASLVYTMSVLLTICFVLAFQLPKVGPWLAAALLVSMLWKVLVGNLNYLTRSPELIGHRRRALSVVSTLLVALTWAVVSLPVHQEVIMPGTVQWDRVVELRAPIDGYVRRVPIRQGMTLTPGDVLLEIDPPRLQEELARAEAEVQALSATLLQQIDQVPINALSAHAKLKRAQQQLERVRARVAQATVRAETCGQVINDSHLPLPGKHVNQGEALAKLGTGQWVVRLSLADQHQCDCAPQVGDVIRFRIARVPDQDRWGTVTRVVVRAAESERPVDHEAIQATTAASPVSDPESVEFQLTLQCWTAEGESLVHGDAALVKLKSRKQTLGELLWLRGRQLWHELLLQGA